MQHDNYATDVASQVEEGRSALLKLRLLLQEEPRLPEAEDRLLKMEAELLVLDLERNQRKGERR